MKKILAILLAATMVLSLAACSSPADETVKQQTPAPAPTAAPSAAPETSTPDPTPEPEEQMKIGVSMPTKDLQRWNQDGANMQAQLEASGYAVDLQYANNEIATQVSQLENMITTGCNVLVIAAIDGASLTTVLAQAKAANIPVIAYDRLITNTDAVSYYATFDNYMVGVIQGTYIRDTLDLDNAAGPFNIEIFAGSPDDTNAGYFNSGAMDLLNPYIDEGKLVVISGQRSFEECAIPAWSTETAQARMENLLTAFYATGTQLDAVLSPNDSIANGITNALVSNGYTAGDGFPIITGQDCDITAMKNMLAGTQAMSIFKDTRTLAAKVVEMVNAILTGGTVDINDTETYDNGMGIVPSFLCEPVFATTDNYRELLIDSGYYTEDQLQ